MSPTSQVPLPYKSSGFKYNQVAHDGVPGFKQPTYDDSAWAVAAAPFGTPPGGCPIQSQAVTNWTPNTDMLLRRVVTIPAGMTAAAVWLGLDNDADVYWDGAAVAPRWTHEGCASYDEVKLDLPASGLSTGDHLLAIRAVDRGGDSFVDVTVRQASDGAPPDQRYVSGGSGWHQNQPAASRPSPSTPCPGPTPTRPPIWLCQGVDWASPLPGRTTPH